MQRLLGFLHRLEDGVLALLLGTMVVVAAAQILLRNLLHWNLSWGDPLTRLLVLWVGLLGALAATRENRHIAIDVLSHLLPARGRAATQALGCLFAALVCALVAWHAGRFVVDEHASSETGLLGLPAWLLHAVVPFGFALIALRYALLSTIRARAAAGGEAEPQA